MHHTLGPTQATQAGRSNFGVCARRCPDSQQANPRAVAQGTASPEPAEKPGSISPPPVSAPGLLGGAGQGQHVHRHVASAQV